MATSWTTTASHRCDLCSAECDEATLVRVQSADGRQVGVGKVRFTHHDTIEICPGCTARPVADVLAWFEAEATR